MTPHPSKDGRAPLTREKIVEKALEILDTEGPEKLSMRRLGDALGVEAMAMYHYFPNKDAILDALLDRVVAETGDALPLDFSDWKAVMLSGPQAVERAVAAHPGAAWLYAGRKYSTAKSVQLLEAPLSILNNAGFEGKDLVDATHAVIAYTIGWYLLSSGQGGSWAGPDDAAVEAAQGVAPLTAEYALQLRDWSHGMEEGMLALLDGLEARRAENTP